MAEARTGSSASPNGCSTNTVQASGRMVECVVRTCSPRKSWAVLTWAGPEPEPASAALT